MRLKLIQLSTKEKIDWPANTEKYFRIEKKWMASLDQIWTQPCQNTFILARALI